VFKKSCCTHKYKGMKTVYNFIVFLKFLNICQMLSSDWSQKWFSVFFCLTLDLLLLQSNLPLSLASLSVRKVFHFLSFCNPKEYFKMTLLGYLKFVHNELSLSPPCNVGKWHICKGNHWKGPSSQQVWEGDNFKPELIDLEIDSTRVDSQTPYLSLKSTGLDA
jgi:hypothetical protein